MSSSISHAPDAVIEQIEIAASPDRVFDALVEPEQLGRWWGSSDMYSTRWQVDLSVGGEYLCIASAGEMEMTVRGTFVEIRRPQRLVYTWNASWDLSGETTVSYDLTPLGDAHERTLVRVTHSGFAPSADRAGYQEGWGRILRWIGAWVERRATS